MKTVRFGDGFRPPVINLSYMFADCSSLITVDFSKCGTLFIDGMYYTFDGCSSLVALDLSNFRPTQDVSLSSTFRGCSSLTTLDLSGFQDYKVPWYASIDSMFEGCTNLTELKCTNSFIREAMELAVSQ